MKPIGIKIIFSFLAMTAMAVIIALALYLFYKNQKELLQHDMTKYFKQSQNIAQTIFDHTMENVATTVNSTNFTQAKIDAIRQKDLQKIEALLIKDMPQSLDFTALILPTQNTITTAGFFLYDTKPLIQELKKLNSFSPHRQIIVIEEENEAMAFLVATRAIIDRNNGEIIGIFAGGLEIHSSHKMINEIKNNTKLHYLGIYYNNKPIIVSNNTIDFKKIDAYDSFVQDNTTNTSFWRCTIGLEAKPNGLNIKMGLDNDSFAIIHKQLMNNLTFIALGAILIMGLLFLAISHIFIKPINQLKSHIEEILQDKNFNKEVLKLHIKEYQELANYFQTLFVQQLKIQRRSIQAKNQIDNDYIAMQSLKNDLEAKLEQKQRELKDAMVLLQSQQKQIEDLEEKINNTKQ